ncbi:MAG: 4Fe-4S binding protein [Thermodesulfobacteriota bacterium]
MRDNRSTIRVWLTFTALIAAVIVLSLGASGLWQGKPEKIPDDVPLVFQDGMTIAEFGRINALPNAVLKNAFELQSREDTEKKLDTLNLSRGDIAERITRSRVLEAEYESKNWVKIPLKFALWVLFLATVFVLMRRKKITAGIRKVLYLSAIVAFGILLGSDPSPMGTVKDAIALYGSKGVIFPPRMIALTVFLLLVVIANKFICSWGCQLGTLQDLIFRLNRDKGDRKGIVRQYRPPFHWTNGIRIAFFLIFTWAAFAWAADLIETIDPFRIYKPATIGLAAGIFIGFILTASLFVYRPWCHFFCPFGLVGWFLEKISLFKIVVHNETCIGCRACEKACPSTVMGAILMQDRTVPDCFACGTCIEVCPTDSIRLAAGRRTRPPEGKFLPPSHKK